MDSVSPPNLVEFLRLKSCPACDYSLATLPPQGVCPECGRAYDQNFVVLTGQGRGQSDTLFGGTWRGMVRLGIWLAVMGWLITGGYRSAQTLALGAFAALIVGTYLYIRAFSPREPRMQVWISPTGVAQRSSSPEEARQVNLVLWTAYTILIWTCVSVPTLQRFSPRIAWPLVGVLTIAMVAMWFYFRKRRWPRGDVDRPGEWPWSRIEELQVKALDSGRVRISCMRVKRWWRIPITHEWVVDIEVPCPAELVDPLREWMTRVMLQGRQPPVFPPTIFSSPSPN